MSQPYIISPPDGESSADKLVAVAVEEQIRNLHYENAQQLYLAALKLDPFHAIATNNLAVCYAQVGMFPEAAITIERARLFDTRQSSIVEMNWGLIALDMDQIELALEKTGQAVQMSRKPPTLFAHGMVLTAAGQHNEALKFFDECLTIQPTHLYAAEIPCFMQALCDTHPRDLLAWRKRWYEAYGYKGERKPHDNDRDPSRPLRVGYVSGDFRTHSASSIFKRVLFHHSSDVELFLYSTNNFDKDPLATRFSQLTGWRDICKKSDEEAEALIRNDKIDILVDLSAHSGCNRLPLFTRKPAPIQVTAWGFALGTGIPEMDYFFADPVVIPQDEREFFSEEIVDLPCVMTFDPTTFMELPGVSPPPVEKNGYITFGSFNKVEKTSDECLSAWAEILRRVPNSRIRLKDNAWRRPFNVRRVRRIMEEIDHSRIQFYYSTTHQQHLEAYQECDLILDSFPHGGGVVSVEALFMGVPVLTRYGKNIAGRLTSSLLKAVGHPYFVAADEDLYYVKALHLANTPNGRTMLSEMRSVLRADLLASPIIAGYPEAVEAKYRWMWERYCAAHS